MGNLPRNNEKKNILLILQQKSISFLILLEIIDEREVLFLMSLNTYELSNRRYKLIFSFENLYGIFRTNEVQKEHIRSKDYELVYLKTHENMTQDDVLKDLIFLNRSGEVDMQINDIVCIKINGEISCFRFSGIKNHNPECTKNNFAEIKNFLEEEKKEFVSKLHSENKILSVLDGQVYEIGEIDPAEHTFFCIHNEIFKKSSRSANITAIYSLYSLKNMVIAQANQFSQPFVTIQHALYFFNKYKKRNPKSMLLLNRAELEMIKDFYQLRQLVV